MSARLQLVLVWFGAIVLCCAAVRAEDEGKATGEGNGGAASAAVEAAAPSAGENATNAPDAAGEVPIEPQYDSVRLLSPEKGEWFRTVRSLAYGEMLDVSTEKYRQAEEKLLEITDPNALEPMAIVLYNRNTRWRSSFVKATRQYTRSQDDFASKLAVTYLSDAATMDPSSILRGQARAALVASETPRYPERLKYQLASNTDSSVRSRAASLLADLDDDSMVSAMIGLLVTEEWRLIGKEIETRKVFLDIRADVAGPPDLTNTATITAAVPMGLATATITLPRVHVTSIRTSVSAPAGVKVDYHWEKVSVKHPGILEALRRLTGRNYGYNQSDWAKWLRSDRGGTVQTGRAGAGTGSPYDIQWDD